MTDICEKYVRDEYSADGKLERVWFDLPDNFNFGYDVVDHIAKNEPQKRAIVFKSLKGDVTEYSFEDVSKKSSRIANMLMEQGIKEGRQGYARFLRDVLSTGLQQLLYISSVL